jgi:methionyl aminopeptidase
MHEDPKIPNYWDDGARNEDFELVPGLVLAIEPMVNAGTHTTRPTRDSWTIVTGDGKCSAHFEHTIAVTEHGADVLTAGEH